MHHIYPIGKGDPLCPLGFHPQVRWPTRCKRCFRDYKEHDGKKKEEKLLQKYDSTSSTPNLNSWTTNETKSGKRIWASSSNLSNKNKKESLEPQHDSHNLSSWTSTPDLQEDSQVTIPTVSLTLHQKRKSVPKRASRTVSDSVLRAQKNSADKNHNVTQSTDASKEQLSTHLEKGPRIRIKEVKTTSENDSSNDVQFLIQVKKSSKIKETDDDVLSSTGTESTLVNETNEKELHEQIENLQKELELTKVKCDKLERERGDHLLRRLAAIDTSNSKTSASEYLKLQQKYNELKSQLEDTKDEKTSLKFKIKELEEELKLRPTQLTLRKAVDDLKAKLAAAETLCEELMDENSDMKKELRQMEEEIEEMQDNFREDQADEYSSLRKELEQTTKNCRILSFKLRKAERKVELLEMQKSEIEKYPNKKNQDENSNKIQDLEQKLKQTLENNLTLQKKLEEVKSSSKKNETIPNIKSHKEERVSNASSSEKVGNVGYGSIPKISRQALTRGGSQEDPAILQRDLNDSLERENDLREQLKFAEEESQNLRKKLSRVEEDNESLLLQLKKMASRKSPKIYPSPHNSTEKGEETTEIKLLLELNDQENKVLREKIKDLETELETFRKRNHESKRENIEAEILNTIGNLENLDINKFINRKKKNPENINNRIQLKKLINDQEEEIGKLILTLKQLNNEKVLIEEEMKKINENNEIDAAINQKLINKKNYKNLGKSKQASDQKSETNSSLETQNHNKINEEILNLRSQLEEKMKIINKEKEMRDELERELKLKSLENSTLKDKIQSLEKEIAAGNNKLKQFKDEYNEKLEKKEAVISSNKIDFNKLVSKYEVLEEEHVATKAKLVMENETLQNKLKSLKEELQAAENEKKTLQNTLKVNKDSWLKEKLNLQEKLQTLEEQKCVNLEISRLKRSFDQKSLELDEAKKENEFQINQIEYLKKENDDLRKKLEDYEKISKIQRNISTKNSEMEKEISRLNAMLITTEKAKRSEITECKIRYEGQAKCLFEEISNLQSQVTRFKRERDKFKHLLDSAQKAIGDLKSSSYTKKDINRSRSNLDEVEELRDKLATLNQQLMCMEDELSEARLEASKYKTELVSEKSSWEVKVSELNSRINKLEEERLLNGKTKIAGLKTKMELAWQKEREEQQRLLQETSTLARDLRQTLFEVERERDKAKLESKRKLEQFKKASEEEQEESKRKLIDLQRDLIELRDAHAKLRTTNEKLKREKDYFEKEREELKSTLILKRRQNQEEEKEINNLLHEIEYIIPFLTNQQSNIGSSSVSATHKNKNQGPSQIQDDNYNESKNKDISEVDSALKRVIKLSTHIKNMRISKEQRNKDRSNVYNSEDLPQMRLKKRKPQAGRSLYRKSISLEHTNQNQQNIWTTETGSVSSVTSLNDSSDNIAVNWKRESSLDSRLSETSIQSDSGGKKKKGLVKLFKTLTKSRSLDEKDSAHSVFSASTSNKPQSPLNTSEEKSSKSDLRGRIAGVFKRSGSSSRSNSLERQNKRDTTSTQRPLMPSTSNNIS